MSIIDILEAFAIGVSFTAFGIAAFVISIGLVS
jgi:preprotein translocase subunit SecD